MRIAASRWDQLYAHNVHAQEKRDLDSQNQLWHDQLNCASDVNCVSAAQARQVQRQRASQAAATRQHQRYTNARLAITASAVCSPQAAGPNGIGRGPVGNFAILRKLPGYAPGHEPVQFYRTRLGKFERP